MPLLFVACEQSQVEDSINFTSSPVIIGEDNRSPVKGIYKPEYRTTGLIRTISADGKQTTCTGVVVGPQHFLTAAHCLFSQEDIPLRDVYFFPGVREDFTAPFGRYRAKRVFFPSAFTKNDTSIRSVGNDIAVVEVEADSISGRSLSALTGTQGIWGRSSIPQNKMSIVSYAGDRPRAQQIEEIDCEVQSYSKHVYKSYCDIVGGQSGSPGFFYHEATKQHYVHTVTVGELTDSNVVAVITPERQKIIVDIYSGRYDEESNDYQEKWKSLSLAAPNKVHIVVHNLCREPVYVAMFTFDKKEAEGFYLLPASGVYEVARTRFSGFDIAMIGKDSKKLIVPNPSLEERTRTVRGQNIQFRRYSSPRFGEYVIKACAS
jgi:V8-like Glu-specific endopeptidase